MDLSRQLVTKNLSDNKTHRAINNEMTRRLIYINGHLYEVELVKSEIEHKEPINGEFLLCTMQNWACYCPIITSLTIIAIWQSWESSRWIHTGSIQHYWSTICIFVSHQQRKKSGTLCEVKTVGMNFQPTQQKISSLVLAVLSIRSTIDHYLAFSKKNSAAQKWFVCVTKHIAVINLNLTFSNLAARVWKDERLKTVVIVPCVNFAKFWKKNFSMYRQQIEVFAQYNMLLPHMSKRRRDCHTFIPKKTISKIKYTLVPFIYNYRHFII